MDHLIAGHRLLSRSYKTHRSREKDNKQRADIPALGKRPNKPTELVDEISEILWGYHHHTTNRFRRSCGTQYKYSLHLSTSELLAYFRDLEIATRKVEHDKRTKRMSVQYVVRSSYTRNCY